MKNCASKIISLKDNVWAYFPKISKKVVPLYPISEDLASWNEMYIFSLEIPRPVQIASKSSLECLMFSLVPSLPIDMTDVCAQGASSPPKVIICPGTMVTQQYYILSIIKILTFYLECFTKQLTNVFVL